MIDLFLVMPFVVRRYEDARNSGQVFDRVVREKLILSASNQCWSVFYLNWIFSDNRGNILLDDTKGVESYPEKWKQEALPTVSFATEMNERPHGAIIDRDPRHCRHMRVP